MNEIWRPVKNFEQYYLISNVGRVKTIKTGLIRKPQIHKDGYLCLIFCVNNIRHIKYIHRLIAEVFIDNPLNLCEVNHIDGNKQNNNVSNLEWCTHHENVIHAHKTGLVKYRKGENINSSKLTDNEVIEIRMLSKKMSGYAIAKKYNVDKKTVYEILHNRSWKHLL